MAAAAANSFLCPACMEPCDFAATLKPPLCGHCVCEPCAAATALCVPPKCTLCQAGADASAWSAVQPVAEILGLEREEKKATLAGAVKAREVVAEQLAHLQSLAAAISAGATAARVRVEQLALTGEYEATNLAQVLRDIDRTEKDRLKVITTAVEEKEATLAVLAAGLRAVNI